MYIDSLQFSANRNNLYPNFNGITKQLKKRTFIDGQKDIKNIINKYKAKNLLVGKLPNFIIKKLPKENKAGCIKEFYQTFENITKELRNFDETKAYSISEIMKRRYNSSVKLLDDLLKYTLGTKLTLNT